MSQESDVVDAARDVAPVSTGDLVVIAAPVGTLFSSSRYANTIGVVTDAHDLNLSISAVKTRWHTILLCDGSHSLIPESWLRRL